MRARPPLRVDLSVRAAVAVGEPFVPRDEPLADAGVARDEIMALTARVEPLVLRVEASGGDVSQRSSVDGDWLYEPDGSSPKRIPPPKWDYGGAAHAWSQSRRWVEAWEECGDPRWMLAAAALALVPQRLIVLAACACARTTRGEMSGALVGSDAGPWHAGPVQAVAAAEAWADDTGRRGRRLDVAMRDRVGAAIGPAVEAADEFAYGQVRHGLRQTPRPEDEYAAIAARSFVAAARTAVATDSGDIADLAASAADLAIGARAAINEPASERKGRLRRMAELVREKVTTLDVLRAVARG